MKFLNMDLGTAWAEIEKMSNRISAISESGCQVEIGTHPQYGRVLFILSAYDNTMMLDVASLVAT